LTQHLAMTEELSRAYNHVKEVIDKITNDTGEGSVTEIQRAIQRGLVEATKISNAWVTTNGINHAMNCIVGEALRTDDIPCIGFCKWPWLQGIFNINIKVTYRFRHRFHKHIPIVVLLFGGNFTTLRALCRYLKTGTPVVVVRV
ncbi:unnamed protein product, partial [Rotaria sordida]